MKSCRRELISQNEVLMIFPFRVAQISVTDLARRRETDDDFLLLDVREQFELQMVKLDDDRVRCIPLSELSSRGTDALPEDLQVRDKEIIVFCHHGSRSKQVAAWLKKQGWQNVFNLEGGIDAYAVFVEPEIGRY
jgi:rhodanese-related sulfurtransferase